MECKTCGSASQQKYCPDCGEQAFDKHQLSVKHFIEETFEGFLHFDNKFLRTLKVLITKPGQLALDYTQGRRVRYMKPIPFFLVINLIFFFIAYHNMYSLELINYIKFRPFTSFNTQHIVNEHLEKTGLTLVEYSQAYNTHIKELSKEFIFLFVPFYGLLLYLLFFWKKKFFVEHLVFAANYMAFVLLVALAGSLLIIYPVKHYPIIPQSHAQDFESIYSLCLEIILAVYLFFAIRRFYQPHWVVSILVAAVFGYFFFWPVQYYRMLLFYIIMYAH